MLRIPKSTVWVSRVSPLAPLSLTESYYNTGLNSLHSWTSFPMGKSIISWMSFESVLVTRVDFPSFWETPELIAAGLHDQFHLEGSSWFVLLNATIIFAFPPLRSGINPHIPYQHFWCCNQTDIADYAIPVSLRVIRYTMRIYTNRYYYPVINPYTDQVFARDKKIGYIELMGNSKAVLNACFFPVDIYCWLPMSLSRNKNNIFLFQPEGISTSFLIPGNSFIIFNWFQPEWDFNIPGLAILFIFLSVK